MMTKIVRAKIKDFFEKVVFNIILSKLYHFSSIVKRYVENRARFYIYLIKKPQITTPNLKLEFHFLSCSIF